jgi:hypothetical protein
MRVGGQGHGPEREVLHTAQKAGWVSATPWTGMENFAHNPLTSKSQFRLRYSGNQYVLYMETLNITEVRRTEEFR